MYINTKVGSLIIVIMINRTLCQFIYAGLHNFKRSNNQVKIVNIYELYNSFFTFNK